MFWEVPDDIDVAVNTPIAGYELVRVEVGYHNRDGSLHEILGALRGGAGPLRAHPGAVLNRPCAPPSLIERGESAG